MKIEIIKGTETPVTKFFSNTPETDEQFKSFPAYFEIDLFCRRLERERDEAREVAKEADAGHDMAIADLAKCEAAAEQVIVRAKELIVRWDQPSWKDTAPTARFINALRIAVKAYEREP